MAGTLYLVATPIGNLDDITLRALRVLREVPLIAAEDTRHSGRLLKHFGIETPMLSYHAHSHPGRLAEILAALEQGDVAVISDAGMPGISDPGFALVQAAIERGIRVEAVPGPSAVTTAVAISGLVPGPFLFLGFPPRRRSERRARFEALATLPYPLVLYEAPHRLAATLADLEASLGDRQVALCRELTKLYEEVIRTTLSGARAQLETQPPRGEYVLVIGAPETPPEPHDEAEAIDLLRAHLEAGASPSSAARAVAQLTKRPRRELYRQALALQRAQAMDEDDQRGNRPDED